MSVTTGTPTGDQIRKYRPAGKNKYESLYIRRSKQRL